MSTYSDIYDIFFFFFFNDTATTEIYTLSLHDALPIADGRRRGRRDLRSLRVERDVARCRPAPDWTAAGDHRAMVDSVRRPRALRRPADRGVHRRGRTGRGAG